MSTKVVFSIKKSKHEETEREEKVEGSNLKRKGEVKEEKVEGVNQDKNISALFNELSDVK